MFGRCRSARNRVCRPARPGTALPDFHRNRPHEEFVIAYRPRNHRRQRRSHRINGDIRAKEVRLVNADGDQVGVVPLPAALNAANEADKDLVEVAPNASPPVCRVMDFGKFEYEQAQKEKAARKNKSSLKEMKYRPNIGDNDYETKTRKVTEFLESGDQVRITVRLRGREMRRRERARDVVDRVVDDVSDIAQVVHPPKSEGRVVTAVLAPATD